MNENYPTHKETFDVVLLKKGINSMEAKAGDFKRITVTTTDPLAAKMSDDALKEKDYVVLDAVPPGVQVDAEIHARRRELEGGSGSTCRVCLNSPCTCRKAG